MYTYYEYCSVNHNKTIDVYHNDTWVHYYTNNYDGKQVDESDIWCKWWNFDTSDFPAGNYQVKKGLLDDISSKSTSIKTYFTLL